MRQVKFAGVNTGVVDTVTTSVETSASHSERSQLNYGVQVVQASGTITAAVVTVQVSADGTNWVDTANTISGAGIADNKTTALRYLRLKVTTASTVASTADITVQMK